MTERRVIFDHGLVVKCAWTACHPYGRPQVHKFALFETPSSTHWAWPMPGRPTAEPFAVLREVT
jgi:hypothetical protein